MSVTAVGKWIPKDQVQAYMQKVAEDTKRLAKVLPPAAPTPQTSASKVTSSAAVTVQSAPSSSDTTKTYANGSPEAENVGMATGMAHSARNNIEMVTLVDNIYNNSKTLLEDGNTLEKLRKVYGDQRVDKIIEIKKRDLEFGTKLMGLTQSKMRSEFSVSGTVVTQDGNGFYRTGQYTQEASSGGWSVSVKSTGEAKATANGIDVSARVPDKSTFGLSWADEIAKQQRAQGVDVAT